MMLVNLTVTLGQLLQICVTLGGLLALYVGIEKRLTRIETQLEPLWQLYERRKGTTGTGGIHP